MQGSEKPRPGILRFVEDRKPLNPRVQAVLVAARYHGLELDPQAFVRSADEAPTSVMFTLIESVEPASV